MCVKDLVSIARAIAAEQGHPIDRRSDDDVFGGLLRLRGSVECARRRAGTRPPG
jgi:hypothetical protein